MTTVMLVDIVGECIELYKGTTMLYMTIVVTTLNYIATVSAVYKLLEI